MSEKTKETDIVERLEKEAASIKHQVRGQDPADWKEIGLMQEAADCITRLRADPPTGWREGIEAAAKVCDEEALESYENSGFNAFNRAAKRIRALVPPGEREGREMSGFKDFIVEYQFQGVQWGATIKAASFDEAKARIEAMGAFGRIKGEIKATIPGTLGPLAWLWAWLGNFFGHHP